MKDDPRGVVPEIDRIEGIARIVGKAEEAIRRYGGAKVTVADIATACDMSPANVYRFFENKESIKAAVVEAMLKRQCARLQRIAQMHVSAGRRLTLFVVELHESAQRQYLRDRHMHDLVLRAVREMWPVVDEHLARVLDACSQIVNDGVRAGEFNPGWKAYPHSMVFNATLSFWHPQLIAENVAADGDAALMGEFLGDALRRAPASLRRNKLT